MVRDGQVSAIDRAPFTASSSAQGGH
jgi:hypothetical protein